MVDSLWLEYRCVIVVCYEGELGPGREGKYEVKRTKYEESELGRHDGSLPGEQRPSNSKRLSSLAFALVSTETYPYIQTGFRFRVNRCDARKKAEFSGAW
jgi:hypothetical protein